MRPTSSLLPTLALPVGLTTLALMTACGGGSKASLTPVATGAASIIVTDAPSDLWAAVEVVVTKVTLVNKADHAKEVVAFEGTSAKINLVDLDSVGELLAMAKIPVGTYDAVRISIDPNPANINLVKADGTTVPTSQIHVVGGTNVWVALSSDLVVTENSSNAVQLDFDLSHPMFLVQMPDGSWVMNLQVKHRPNAASLASLALHHHKGTVTSTTATSFLMHTQHGADLTIHVDGGAWFWDVDAKAAGSLAGLTAGKYLLVSTRMQADGSLWAVRVWYSANPLPDVSPEGHVYGVDRANNKLIVSASNGTPRAFVIDSDTTFTYRTALSLGTGGTGGALDHVWQGFKVQLEVKDPLAAPLHAKSVNIQRAVDGGKISAATVSSFTYTHPMMGVDRTYAYDPAFSWWYLRFPGVSSTSLTDFAAAVTGAGDVRVQGLSDLTWNATNSVWDAANAIFVPVSLPIGSITTSYNGGQLGFTFTNSSSATQAITTTLNTTVGMQPMVLEVHNQTGVLTVTPLDVTTWSAKLVAPTPAKVVVVPKPDGTFAAYAVVIFTGF